MFAVEQLISNFEDTREHGYSWNLCNPALALARMGDDRGLRVLLQAMSDKRFDIRFVAASALCCVGRKEGVDLLIQVYNDRHHTGRKPGIVRSLVCIDDARIEEFMAAALNDKDPAVRYEAATYWKKRGDVNAVEHLFEALKLGPPGSPYSDVFPNIYLDGIIQSIIHLLQVGCASDIIAALEGHLCNSCSGKGRVSVDRVIDWDGAVGTYSETCIACSGTGLNDAWPSTATELMKRLFADPRQG